MANSRLLWVDGVCKIFANSTFKGPTIITMGLLNLRPGHVYYSTGVSMAVQRVNWSVGQKGLCVGGVDSKRAIIDA